MHTGKDRCGGVHKIGFGSGKLVYLGIIDWGFPVPIFLSFRE
jgi:hypothetical protein